MCRCFKILTYSLRWSILLDLTLTFLFALSTEIEINFQRQIQYVPFPNTGPPPHALQINIFSICALRTPFCRSISAAAPSTRRSHYVLLLTVRERGQDGPTPSMALWANAGLKLIHPNIVCYTAGHSLCLLPSGTCAPTFISFS